MFEKFIKTCLDYYGLDPCHYFSSPGLIWDAMLKMTGVKLDLILDIDMHLFIEVVFHIFLKDVAKQIMTLMKKLNLLCIWMQVTYMVGQ